jgi:transcriptional regulator with XRE-family HTH domain
LTYGERLRELRAERRLSLRQVEERGGPNKDTMSLIERDVHRPHPQTLGRIANALDISVPELRAELEAASVPLAQAPPEPDEYATLLKELGFSSKQIEAWRRQDELEKMSAKDLLEALMASPESLRLRKYYRENPPQVTEPPRSESA